MISGKSNAGFAKVKFLWTVSTAANVEEKSFEPRRGS
jgi:hypothetical protein